MNVSHTHKTIWWAPERTATNATAQIFKNYDFYYNPTSDISNLLKLCEPYHSHEIEFPEEFRDYKVICNVRNPYDRVLSIFVNFVYGSKLVYTKDKEESFKYRFKVFVDESILSNIEFINENTEKGSMDILHYFTKYEFSTKSPDFFIRMENLKEDLGKIDFILNSDQWKNSEFDNFIEKNKFIMKRPYRFQDLYTFDVAKKVFHFFKNHFFLANYDPFSFTDKILTDDQKKSFLHDID
jgi:hypothetical protein